MIRELIWRLVRFILFRRDAENVHAAIVGLVRRLKRRAPVALRLASGVPLRGPQAPASRIMVFGMEFLSRVGLAGGFDKDAEVVDALPDLGFGFAEIGTVTPRAQPGNERPRLIRDVPEEALFNRMGFNNAGAEKAARSLEAARPHLPFGFRVGVNLGKNRDTPLESAAEDYRRAALPFLGLADFFVINVSSPNTPGLRALQGEDALKRILEQVLEVSVRVNPAPPVLIKLAPEVAGEDLRRIIVMGDSAGVAGWGLTNTLGGKYVVKPETGESLSGGWSGSVLTRISRERLSEARKFTTKPIISAGGIMTEEEAYTRHLMGAELVQVYSGWIFRGPGFPQRISRALETF